MINIVDLFAGPGGLSLGFELARDAQGKKLFNLLKAVEMDPWACRTLRNNFSDGVIIEGDIRNKHIKKILKETCQGKTDIVVAGPPCQSFSLIGPRSGNNHNEKNKYKYDGLYKEFIDIVKILSPKFVVFENVKGILSKKNGDKVVIDIIVSKLQRAGYSFRNENKNIKTKYLILNAADYGVPQTRERVFLIGNNIGVDNPFPQETHCNSKKKLLPYVTLFDAIGDLPKIKPKKTNTHISAKRKIEIEEYNRKIYPGEGEVEYKEKWAKNYIKKLKISGKKFFSFVRPSRIPLTHHVCRQQMETDIKLFQGMRQGMTAKDVIENTSPQIRELAKYIRYDMNSFRDKYKKQHWKKPCSTIFAHMQKDGNRFIHPKQARTLTPREAARVQSFPDSFYFEGPITKKFQQIGNAVPPLLAKRIAESIAKTYYYLNKRKITWIF